MSDNLPVPQRDFPADVYQSLAELRHIAKTAKSRNDERLRWATPDEIALAETQRKAWHCDATSSRTGLPCTKARVTGTNVCAKHGASAGHVRAAADQRVLQSAAFAVSRIKTLATQDKHLPTAFKAAQDLADRAGIGLPVQAKVRSSHGAGAAGRLHIHLGFMGEIAPHGVAPDTRFRVTSVTETQVTTTGSMLPGDEEAQKRQQIIDTACGDPNDIPLLDGTVSTHETPNV